MATMLLVRGLAALVLAVWLWAAPALADGTVFGVDLASDPASLDPQVQWDPDSYAVYRNIFDNLLARDRAGRIVPQVATSWAYKSDTRIVFQIRPGIRFQDGTQLTPADVVFSIRRITDPAFKSPQLSQFDQIASAEVTGPHEVTVTTRTAYPVLLAQLTKLSIVPQSVVTREGDVGFNRRPVGSGPYAFVSRTQGVKVALAANPDYWRGKPPFPRVEMHAVPDEATRIADVHTGRADITRILSTDDADALRSDPQVKLLWTPTERVTLLALDTLTGPMADHRVREATAYAIDKNLLVEALLKGYAKPVDEPLTPASFGYDPSIPAYRYDPARAKALLRQAGVTAGTRLRFLTSPVFDQRVVQALQQMLADVGLDAQITTVDAATYLKLRQGSPQEAGDVSYFRWSCGCEDADGTLFPLFDSGSAWAKYRNPEVDRVLQAARSTLDARQRASDYHTALLAIHRDIPVVPLFQDVVMFAARKPVQFTPTADEAFSLLTMRWRK